MRVVSDIELDETTTSRDDPIRPRWGRAAAQHDTVPQHRLAVSALITDEHRLYSNSEVSWFSEGFEIHRGDGPLEATDTIPQARPPTGALPLSARLFHRLPGPLRSRILLAAMVAALAAGSVALLC